MCVCVCVCVLWIIIPTEDVPKCSPRDVVYILSWNTCHMVSCVSTDWNRVVFESFQQGFLEVRKIPEKKIIWKNSMSQNHNWTELNLSNTEKRKWHCSVVWHLKAIMFSLKWKLKWINWFIVKQPLHYTAERSTLWLNIWEGWMLVQGKFQHKHMSVLSVNSHEWNVAPASRLR